MANHYIRTNQAREIIHGFSDAHEQPQDGDILVLEDGLRHHHEAFPEPYTNERGQYLYKWIEGEKVAKTQEDLDTEWNALPQSPDRLRATEDMLLEFMLGGI